MAGALWEEMDARPRRSMRSLRKEDIDESPGVYAIYRNGAPEYVGVAEKQTLRDRIWKNHSGRGRVMTGSAFRRNVAEHLGIATASDIKDGTYQPTDKELDRVREWIDGCEIAWIACESSVAARLLEGRLKLEWMPRLTKQ